ncbi:hypothetical protein BJ508DRAFT_137216 [Ascobolus immersus RN42]|uniref:Uncharacterized protein n=1 Tax=Ascobolus immersus RN42 TaxID=1160509 RepID=A0A3N4I350_ASCIM|nr:hypothetical protein BJ508DRAFT_137216 [Ascobolus immersus RN42]
MVVDNESVDSDDVAAVDCIYYESLLLDHPDHLLRGTNTEVTSPSQHPLAQQIYQLTVLFFSSTSSVSELKVGNAIHIGDGLFLTSAHLLRMPHENLNRVHPRIFAYSGLLPRPHLYDISMGNAQSIQLSILSYLSTPGCPLPRGQILSPDTDIPSSTNLCLLRVTCPSDTPSNEGYPVPTYFPTNIRDARVQFLGINQTFRLSRSLLKQWRLRGASEEVHRVLGTLLPGKLSTTRGKARYVCEEGGGVVLHSIPATSSASGSAICCGRELYGTYFTPTRRLYLII